MAAMIASIIFLFGFVAATILQPPLYRASAGRGKFYNGKSKQHFFIPSGQCTGYLNLTNTCFSDQIPQAFRVTVKESTSLPIIQTDDKSDSVNIYRNDPCDELAYVTFKFHCLGEIHVSSRIRDPLPPVANPEVQLSDIQQTSEMKQEKVLPTVPDTVPDENENDKELTLPNHN